LLEPQRHPCADRTTEDRSRKTEARRLPRPDPSSEAQSPHRL
jgi:hypothetical protein